jgi:hypothetical protein
MGPREGVRAVSIFFDSRTRKIEVRDETSKLVRTISLARHQPFHMALASDSFTVVLQLPKEYDLVSGIIDRTAPTSIIFLTVTVPLKC